MSGWNLYPIQFVPFAPLSSPCGFLWSVPPSNLQLPLKNWNIVISFPGAFSSLGIKEQTPSIFPHRAGSSIVFLGLFWTASILSTSFLNCGNHNWTQYSRCNLTSPEQSGMIAFLSQLVKPWRCSPGCDFYLHGCSSTLLSCAQLVVYQDPQVPCSKAAPLKFDSQAICLFCVRWRTSHFCVLIFLLAHSSSLSRFLSKTDFPSVPSTSPPSLVPLPLMVTVLSVPSSRSFMNTDHHDLSASFLPNLQTPHLICISPVFLEVLYF